MPVSALKARNKCSTPILNRNSLFGVKIIVLGGDSKQLQIVPRASPAIVVDVCLKFFSM